MTDHQLCQRNNLTAPLEYWLANTATRNEICSGCGTKGFSAWICPDTLYGLDITDPCNIHDWMYHHGACVEHKDQADRIFLNNMIRTIEKNLDWLAPLRRRRALKYYEAVKYWGGPAFWNKTYE